MLIGDDAERELAALPVGFERGHRLSMRGGGHHLIWFLGAARDELSRWLH